LIPDFDASTGHLPLGRYHAALEEVHARFVAHPAFTGSPTRQAVWDGFIAYMSAWRVLEDNLAEYLGGKRLLMTTWLAGSFVSGKFDPGNLDLTLLVDGELAASCRGKPGIAGIKKLSHRDAMLAMFRVSPCIVQHRYFRSPFRQQIVGNPEIKDYVMMRGAFDDWWQRARPDGVPKGEPTRGTADARRGYLEVEA
jgi:hypothetical protein